MDNIKFMQGTKTIKDVYLEDQRVVIRVDFNVPLDQDFNIHDDTRIRETIPTINYCIDNGVKSIVLVSHLGRPKGIDPHLSLKHLLKRLERLLGRNVVFTEKLEHLSTTLSTLPKGGVVLLENIRFYPEEENNDEVFAKRLADFCDIYVNDAFGAAHRKHASTYGMAKFTQHKVAGLLLKKEINSFAKALANPLKPVLLIVGGAKVSSKLTLLSNILDSVDKIIIGGAMSNTFLQAIGYNMQNSSVEEHLIGDAIDILRSAKSKGVKIYLPVDVVCTDHPKNPTSIKTTPAQDVPENMMAVDLGPASIKLFSEVIRDCETIIWNGPMGIYEVNQFSRGTFSLAHVLADTYAYSVIGGGDTADAIDKAGERDSMSFTSTGGGASLELLEGKVLPAFEALDRV